MDEKEFKIAYWTLVITTIINIITVGYNIYWNILEKKEKRKLENYINARNTIVEYYLPIKYYLLNLELYWEKVRKKVSDFDVFSLYSVETKKKTLRNELLNEYRKYIEGYEKLEKKYSDIIIDKQLDKLYLHILFILTIDDEQILHENKNKYEIPCIGNLIEHIDKYAVDKNIFPD